MHQKTQWAANQTSIFGHHRQVLSQSSQVSEQWWWPKILPGISETERHLTAFALYTYSDIRVNEVLLHLCACECLRKKKKQLTITERCVQVNIMFNNLPHISMTIVVYAHTYWCHGCFLCILYTFTN